MTNDWDKEEMDREQKRLDAELAKPIKSVPPTKEDLELIKRRKSSTSDKNNINVNITSLQSVDIDFISLPHFVLTDLKYLVEDFMPLGCINLWYAFGGHAKSYLALYLAVLVAIGRPFLGNWVKKGKVLYCDFELSPELQRQRLERICKGLNIDPRSFGDDDLLYVSPNNITDFIQGISGRKMDLIIIDSIGAGLSGDPESARDICGLFQKLRQLGTILLIDHQPKMQRGDRARDKSPFGSVFKFNLSRNIYHINAVQGENNTLKCLLKHTKSNFTALRQPIGLEMDFSNGGLAIRKCDLTLELAEHLELKEQIKAALAELGQASAQEIADAIEAEVRSVRTKISSLKKSKQIEEVFKKAQTFYYSLATKYINKGCIPVDIDVDIDSIDSKTAVQIAKEELDAEIVDETTVNQNEIPF